LIAGAAGAKDRADPVTFNAQLMGAVIAAIFVRQVIGERVARTDFFGN
jgi:hypothetical protein